MAHNSRETSVKTSVFLTIALLLIEKQLSDDKSRMQVSFVKKRRFVVDVSSKG